jgi:hypothetical protein
LNDANDPKRDRPDVARATHLLTHDEARRIAANIAKLPEWLCAAVRHQKLPAAFSGPARGIPDPATPRCDQPRDVGLSVGGLAADADGPAH